MADVIQDTLEGVLRQPEKLFDLLSLPVLTRVRISRGIRAHTSTCTL